MIQRRERGGICKICTVQYTRHFYDNCTVHCKIQIDVKTEKRKPIQFRAGVDVGVLRVLSGTTCGTLFSDELVHKASEILRSLPDLD